MLLRCLRRRRRRLARRVLRRGLLIGLGLIAACVANAQSLLGPGANMPIGPVAPLSAPSGSSGSLSPGASLLGPGANMPAGPVAPIPGGTVQTFGPGVRIAPPGALPTTITPAPGGATSDSATVSATTVNPFGPAGQPPNRTIPSLTQPYGEGAIVNTPGKPLVVCTPSGSTVTCR